LILELYRGIAISPDKKVTEVIRNMKDFGISGEEGRWRFTGWRLRPYIEQLFQKQSLSTKDTREGYEEFLVVPFADELGAYYYALRHNYKEGYIPLVIRARIDLYKKYVYVDGRDFLYTVFGMWDKRGLVKTYGIVKAYQIVSNTLKAIYGDKVDRYFEKASKTTDSDNRISLCDLAVHDLDVVLAHANNRIVIRGRYNVTFKSSFFVEAPIASDEILEVFRPDPREFDFKFDVNLYTWL